MYFSAVVYYSKIHNGWVIVTLNFTRTKSMESDGCINDGTRWWMKIFEQLKVCRIFWKKPQKLKSSYIRLYLRFIFEEKKGLCLNICYAYTTKQNNVKVKDDGWFWMKSRLVIMETKRELKPSWRCSVLKLLIICPWFLEM